MGALEAGRWLEVVVGGGGADGGEAGWELVAVPHKTSPGNLQGFCFVLFFLNIY